MLDIKLKLRGFLNIYFEDCEIDDNDNIFEIGHISSLFAMQLILFLEKEYGIKVANEEMDMNNFKSLNAIKGFIIKKQNNATST
jgi:acyl carrier protein